MAESRFTVSIAELFTFYRNTEHSSKQKQKHEEEEESSYNKEKGFHPTKIHICLSEEAFNNFKEELKDLLIPYVESGVIASFKIINETEFKETSKRLANKLEDTKLFEKTRKMLMLKKKRFDRFLNGDQITIYLPELLHLNQISKLCKELNEFISDKKLQAGNPSEFAVKITEHINLRMPYLESNPNERIDAISANENDLVKIQASHQEIRHDILFR